MAERGERKREAEGSDMRGRMQAETVKTKGRYRVGREGLGLRQADAGKISKGGEAGGMHWTRRKKRTAGRKSKDLEGRGSGVSGRKQR